MGFSGGVFPSGFPTKILYPVLIFALSCPSHPPWVDHPDSIGWRVWMMKYLIMDFSAAYCSVSSQIPIVSSAPYYQTPSIFVFPADEKNV